MAEALAALEAALTPLLKQIPDLLLQEWRHAEEAKKELESLNDTIGQIRVFLDEAGSEEVVNEQLKMSMKRAWKSLYDSQDAIDDLMRHRSSCQWEGLGAYIYDLYDQQSFTSKARDIREVFEKFASMRKVTRDMIEAIPAHRSSADHATSRSTCRNSSVAYSDESDDELVGIARARELLVEWLLEKDVAPKVIFVHGMQGIGKTTLVGAILRDQRVKREFKYYVWMKDVRSCESSADKDEELMKANAELCDVTNSDNNQGELREILRDLKKNDDRWVLVLDDMSRPDVFESLARHLPQTRPSVLVTTRVSSLASDSQTVLNSLYAGVLGGNPETRGRANLFYDVLLRPISLLSRWVIPFLSGWMVDLISVRSPPRETTPYGVCDFKPDFLSKHDSITLLCRKMGWPDGCPHPLRNALDSILEKCDGLPLAILAACKLLTYSQNHDRDTPQSATWTSLSSRLGEELLIKRDKDRAIKEMTTLRIDHLQDVKTCLFYLSTFPLDRPVKCSTLIRLWMAERFIVQTGAKPLQTIAEESLQKIVDHNLIQKVEKTSYGRISAFRVHNIMHQILVSKSRDVEFVTTVADPAVPWPETIWRLSFHIPVGSISKDMPVNRLRSLFVFAAVYPQSMRELLGKVKRLNVLDLRDSSLNSFPKEILKLLYLRYLSLRGTKVHIIPDAIGDLTHLETLDLKHTAVSKLPKGILKLKKLRHLLVYRFDENPTATQPKYGIKTPSELGVLTSLEKLCFVEMKEKKSQEHFQSKEAKFLAGLGNLERLLRLGISKLRKEHGEFLCSALVKLTKLESIHLIAATGGETIDLLSIDKSKAFPFLQRVQLIGSLRVLPEWISSLTSLVKLVLKESRLIEDPLNHLQHLPYLKHLALHETFDASHITFLTSGFQQLRFLGLDTFDDLTAIDAEEEALPTLERLFLARCKLLTTVPQVVTRPRKLNCLELYRMPDEFMTNIEGNKEVGACMKVVKKWRDGIVDYNVMQRKAVIRRTDGSSSWPPPPSICGK